MKHLLAIAMVGCDQCLAALFQDCIQNAPGAGVDGFDRPDGGAEDARVSDHIGVGKIEDDQVIEAFFDPFDHFVGERNGAHFGLQVVGGDFRRRSHDSLLAGVGGFLATVEEVSDVRILLRFGHASLL